MRILIIADESFASRERAMLSRLEVGLADEGVRVVHVIPRIMARWHGPELSSQTITYESRGLGISLAWRVQQVMTAVRALGGGQEQPFDLVHAFGHACWGFAAELARQAGVAMALEVHSAESASLAAKLRPVSGAGPSVYLLPDPALERPVRGGDVGIQVRLTPWGVHTPAAPPRARAAGAQRGGDDRG